MIKVYKTNIDNELQKRLVILEVTTLFPQCKVSVDLKDCDRVLRIEGLKSEKESDAIQELLQESGFEVEVMTW